MKRTERKPSTNGQAPKPKRKPRGQQQEPASPPPPVNPSSSPDDKHSSGRLASDLVQQSLTWLVKPWIPKGMLSMVIGHPNVGKSTFVAWLIAQAGCAVILPGFEEVVEIMTLPRLRANGVQLRLLRLLDDRPYRLPRDVRTITRIMRSWEAELLVIDPIDSYMEESMSENNGKDVRAYLESCAAIAQETGAAVVGVRHPGKDRHNPMPGSRQWRAVPRQIVELVGDGGTPPRMIIRHFRDALGQDAKPREYELQGDRGQPRRFALKGELDASLNDLSLVSSDPTGRRKVLEAAALIRHMFEQEEKPAVQDLVGQCRVLGIGEHARDEAKRLLGIISTPLEAGGKWVMLRRSKDWPEWLVKADSVITAGVCRGD